MAANTSGVHGRLDATGEREVVFCHQCENEWYRDEYGLICPRCQGDVTEIVTLESDPRPFVEPTRPPPPDILGLQNHYPWEGTGDASDPEEADIEEHITRGPNGNVLFQRTIRTSAPLYGGARRRRDPLRDPTPDTLNPNDPENVMRDFQNMVSHLMGPQFQTGQAGRSGPETLYATHASPFGGGFSFGGGRGRVVGSRVTFTSSNGGPLRPRDPDAPQPAGPPVDDLAGYASPPHPRVVNGRTLYVVSIRAPPDNLARILGSMFGAFGPPPGQHAPDNAPVMPGLQGLFATLFNPANARSGDAVYTQEALDQIISTLMEQSPSSNAPGPASPDAIAALPKKNLTEKELGPEGKGECSVCMDDVKIGDEVVSLPCAHWFHEQCASAWLSEHNTCPICRKGIEGESSTSSSSRRASQTPPTTRNEHRARRLSTARQRLSRENTVSGRNEARLDAIRNAGRFSPTEDNNNNGFSRSWGTPPPVPHDTRPTMPTSAVGEDYAAPMPGSFFRQPSDMSDHQRDGRRGTSGSDRSRDSQSRRSSQSGGSNGGGGGGGPMSWIRDRFGSGRRAD